MARKTVPLTDLQVKSAKSKNGKNATYFDGGGLYLLVSPSGSKGWRFKYRINNKEKLMSFGTYPEISLSEARKLRSEARALVTKGIDPIKEKQGKKRERESAQENTFKKIAQEWYENQNDLADKTKYLYMRRLELDILPLIGEMPISEIKPKEILDLVLRPMENRGVGEMTYRVKSIISKIFRFAVASGYTERDVTNDLTGALKKITRNHRAAITEPKELGKLLKVVDNYNGYKVVKYALKLMPHLFVRPGELRSMEWKDIDFKNAEWRYLVKKTKTQHIVPLSTQSMKILKEVKVISGKSTLVFPSIRSNHRPISNNTLNAALRRLGYTKEEVSAHGFRATARTILEEILQERIEYIEHQLAHQVKDALGRAYNRTKHLQERHRMMQRWSDYLDDLKKEKKILKIKRKVL